MNDGQQHVLEALPTYTNYKFNWKAKSILLNILISLQCLRDMNRDHKDLSGGKSVFFSQTILHTISFLILFFFRSKQYVLFGIESTVPVQSNQP